MRKSEVIFIIIYLLCIAVLACSCTTTRYASSNVSIQKDTVIIKALQRDSVFFRDSVYTFVKGDTFLTKEYHTKYISSIIHDTIYKHSTDTIRSESTITIEKKESLLKRVGHDTIVAIISVILFVIIRIIIKKRFLI